jgi:hypothetical protein
MKTATPSQSNKALEQLRKRLDVWRKSSKPRTRIPENLWDAAVRAAAEYGINRTAKTLRLDYYNLKKRLAASVKDQSPSFIELLPAASSASEYVMELESRNGTKMRIQVKGAETQDAITLIRELGRIKR